MTKTKTNWTKSILLGAGLGTFLGTAAGVADLTLAYRASQSAQRSEVAIQDEAPPREDIHIDRPKISELESKVDSVIVNSSPPLADGIKIPVYSEFKVPKNNCSRYVRLAAKDLFSKIYDADDAWNLRYKEKFIGSVGSNWEDDIRTLANNGTLKPGMIVGIKNPKSSYRFETDIKGLTAKYTHVALYIGVDQADGQPVFAEKVGSKTLRSKPSDIKSNGMKIVEILDAN